MEVNKFYNTLALGIFGFLLILFLFMEKPTSTYRVKYFKTKEVDVLDDYFGTKIKDPFRWLEDDHTKETKNWVYKQNQVTSQYLSKIPDSALYAYNVYQIEGEGRKLFSEIIGNEDTIMGLPIQKIKEYLEEIK